MKLRMRRTKRRYTTKRRTYRRTRNRLLSYKNPNKKEVKHFTIYTNNPLAVKQDLYGAGSAVLRHTTFLANSAAKPRGILSSITIGTSSGQRIGNTTFVKSVSCNMLIWLCPGAADSASYDAVTVRILVHNAPGYNTGTDIANFFDYASTIPIMNRPERANFNVYYDKTFTMTASTPVAGTSRIGKGVMRHLKFRIPINRAVEYTQNEDGAESQVKNNRDIISISAMAYSPSVADGTQLCCLSHSTRMYYTDD